MAKSVYIRQAETEQRKPIRVAQVLNRMDSGGIEAVVLNYFRFIDREQFRFDFFCSENSTLPYRHELEAGGAEIHLLPSYKNPVKYGKVLGKLLRDGEYDMVHVHMNALSVFALAATWRSGIPVRICHNHSTASWREGARTLGKVLLRPWCRVFATDFFACGEKAAVWMYGRRRTEAGRVTILPNAIEAKVFAFDSAGRNALREKLGIAQDAFVIGHVGRFMKQKNHAYLLQLFRRIAEERPDAVLLLVGEGKLEEMIRKQAEKLGIAGRIVFAGVRTDMKNVYSAMDVFCLPSLYEGFPVVLVEAQANGLPVVCSDRISKEVCMTELVVRISLEDRDAWMQAVRKAERKTVLFPEEYELQHAVRILEEKYRNLADR